MTHQKVSVLGAAGTIGRSAIPELLKQGFSVRAVGRDREKLSRAFGDSEVEVVTADLTTVQGCKEALSGTDAAIYAVGLPYFKKSFADYPPMMRTCLDAAVQVDLPRMILITNVYPYGAPQMEWVTETHPRMPNSVKGEYRKQQEDLLLAAHGKNGLATLSLRLPDFYGPDAENSLAWILFSAASTHKTASVFAPVDKPHQFFFTPDIGPVLSGLLNRPDLFGTAYNVAGDEQITFIEFARRVYTEFGMDKPKLLAAGRKLLTVFGLFSAQMREFPEMAYLQESPVLLDGSKLRKALPGVNYTSYANGIRATAARFHK